MPQARQISKRGGETDSGEFRQGLPFAAVEARLAFGVREVPTAADLALDSLAILGGVLGVPRPGLPAKRRVVIFSHASVLGRPPRLNHALSVG